MEFDISIPVIRLFKKEQSGVNISLNIGWSLLQQWGCERLLNLDSDVLLEPDWLTVLTNLFENVDFPKNKLILSGFNRYNNPCVISEHENYLQKSRMGGINYYFEVSVLEVIKPFLVYENWDQSSGPL